MSNATADSRSKRATHIVRSLVRILPFKQSAVSVGAQLPPSLKGPKFVRVLEAMRRYGGAPAQVVTNFGIDRRYRIVADGSAEGTLLFGRPDDYSGERGCLDLVAQLVSGCDVFIDIGAYRGYYVFYVRASSGHCVPIHYFEPVPALYGQLSENIARNQLPDVIGHRCAIGAVEGVASFYLDLDDPTSNSLADWFGHKHRLRRIEVPVTTFASFARRHGIDNACVKVDVENAEFAFLEGAGREIRRIRYLIMEVLGPAVAEGFVRRMIESGFSAYYVNDRCLQHSSRGEFSYVPPQYNWLFCRESPSQLAVRLEGSTLRVC